MPSGLGPLGPDGGRLPWYFPRSVRAKVAVSQHSPTALLMADAADRILAALDDEQRNVACFPFPDDKERRRFYWVPTDHGGLSLRSCGDSARALIMQLVASGLSPAGFNTAAVIISLQHVLSRVEGWRSNEEGRQRRDPLEYQLSIFGEPSPAKSWAWRLGGHQEPTSMVPVMKPNFCIGPPNPSM